MYASKLLDLLIDYVNQPPCDCSKICSDQTDYLQDVKQIWKIFEDNYQNKKKGTEELNIFAKNKFLSVSAGFLCKNEKHNFGIPEFVEWNNTVTKHFVEEFKNSFKYNEAIVEAWKRNEREIFLAGASRPFHISKVSNFVNIIRSWYEGTEPSPYKENRNQIFNVLLKELEKESQRYFGTDYKIFPCNASSDKIKLIFAHFYSQNRDNTYFISTSNSDYIPFVHAAQKYFGAKFISCPIEDPKDHTTKMINEHLHAEIEKLNNQNPTILILLTSKNRYGYCIDIDYIDKQVKSIAKECKCITIVDACQDSTNFKNADVVVYSKKFSNTGAIILVKETILTAYNLEPDIKVATNVDIGCIASQYITLNMTNNNITYGVEDLGNSLRWNYYDSPVLNEIKDAFGLSNQELINRCFYSFERNGLIFEFSLDTQGTIITIQVDKDNPDSKELDIRAIACILSNNGIILDCFAMDDSYQYGALESSGILKLLNDTINVNEIRKYEAVNSNYLAWSILPYSVLTNTNKNLIDYFQQSKNYHDRIRINYGKSSFPGKLPKFLTVLDAVLNKIKNKDTTQDDYKKYNGQWAPKI